VTPRCSANRATAGAGADATLSGTKPSRGSVQSCTASPRRLAGRRCAARKPSSAGVKVKYRTSSSRLISGNACSLSRPASNMICVAMSVILY
jgi:hypothetical protein